MIAKGPSLVVGVDVGGTNTDAVLLDVSRTGPAAVLASHKAATTANVTHSVEESLRALLDKSTVAATAAARPEITALAIGTTHFLNAIIERDASRVEKVAVLRLAAYDFSAGTPPFCDWPTDLARIVHGSSAIVPGGCNIDGTLIAELDEQAVREHAAVLKAKGLRNVVVVGIGSPADTTYGQEDRAAEIIREVLEEGDGEGDGQGQGQTNGEGKAKTKTNGAINIVKSRDVAGSGLLARENAAILNAAILNFAGRAIRSFVAAMRRVGLQCPLYLTSNAGHLLPFSEAMRFPIRIFSSGATNSIRGAAFLAGSPTSSLSAPSSSSSPATTDNNIDRNGCVVVDIGGTTTDVGYLLKNGYPRLAKSYTDLAGVKVNLEMPSVDSVGLGGGSVVHVSTDADSPSVTVGPDSVGHDLLTKARCFGGELTTATDVVVASGTVELGTHSVELPSHVISKATSRMQKMLETYIDRAKLSPDPCTVILVGGGSILCPPALKGVGKIVVPEHAGVANAIGAAMAKIAGSAETIVRGAGVAEAVAEVKARAVQNAIGKGGDDGGGSTVTVLNEEVVGVPYTTDQTRVKIEVALPANHARVLEDMRALGNVQEHGRGNIQEGEDEDQHVEESKRHELLPDQDQDAATHQTHEDLDNYRPNVSADGIWTLSETDLRFIATGCYILGTGGGGSPYATYIHLRQMLADGAVMTMVSMDDLDDADRIPSVAGVGTPAVSIERPGGHGLLHALDMMAAELGVSFDKLLATEVGGGNGLAAFGLGSSQYYNLPTVDGDLMGRAYPNFEMVSNYVLSESVNELLPVTLCSGTGHNVLIPATQTDETSAGIAIRDACVAMGSACGAAGVPLTGRDLKAKGIPNTHSLSWRLGRVVALAQQKATLSTLPAALIEECGGPRSAARVFTGKIRHVASALTTTAHSVGKVTIERLSDDEMEGDADADADDAGRWLEVVVPFMNENLAVVGRDARGEETVLATVPDLISLLDVATGENIGVQEYRYGLKVTVLVMAPHPIWTTERGLQVGGPAAFKLPYQYRSSLEYTKPRSVIEEFRPQRASIT